MTISEQLIALVDETATPDKARILRMRELARALAGEGHGTAAADLVRKLNGAYLVLQLATLSDHEEASRRYRDECICLVRAIERGRVGAFAPAAFERGAPAERARPKSLLAGALSPSRPAKNTLAVLFRDALGGIYSAERKLAKALPRMARVARSEGLRQALRAHQDETSDRIERLRRVFAMIGRRAQGRRCPAIDGMLEECEAILVGFRDRPVLDAGLLAAARAVGNYEISRYGALKRWAEDLDLAEAAALLGRSLEEERSADARLAALAAALDVRAVAAG